MAGAGPNQSLPPLLLLLLLAAGHSGAHGAQADGLSLIYAGRASAVPLELELGPGEQQGRRTTLIDLDGGRPADERAPVADQQARAEAKGAEEANWQNVEQWRIVRLNQLLDALSSSIPSSTPAPIFRSGRTYQAQQPQPQQLEDQMSLNFRSFRPLPKAPELDGLHQRGFKSSLFGIEWAPAGGRLPKVPQPAAGRPAGLVAAAGAARLALAQAAAGRQPGPAEELPPHSPMHSELINDYEWKRVENSKWNNLRGMWGKRSLQTQP